MTLNEPGPEWVPIRLDGQTVTSAREGERDLPIKTGAADQPLSWHLEVQGIGTHRLTVSLLTAVRSDASGRRISLPVPIAATTRVRLDVPAGVDEALAGPKEPLQVTRMDDEDGRRDRLAAILSPRTALELSWRAGNESDFMGPPVLSAAGEIALEVNRGVLMTQSYWTIRCVRGTARSLALRLEDPGDELLTVELDDLPLPINEDVFDPSTGVVTIDLANDPLLSGEEPRRLSLTTRRNLPPGITARFRFQGFPIDPITQALEQSGVVALVQGEELWVSATAGSGLRQINPLTELPDRMRTRPRIVQAYQFFEQPFELEIRSDPAPPLSHVEVRTTVAVEADTARVESEIDYSMTRGRLREVRVGVPMGLELGTVGPDTVVESWQAVDEEVVDTEAQSGRVVIVRLKDRMTSSSSGASYRIQMSGRQAIDGGPAVRIGLFRPLDGTFRQIRVAVLPARDIAVNLGDDGLGSSFLSLRDEALENWPRLTDLPPQGFGPAMWLWSDLNPPYLPLSVDVLSREVHHETVVTARIEPEQIELDQESVCHVRNGTLDRIEIAVPAELEGRWDLAGDEVTVRERLGDEGDGSTRYRLVLRQEAIDLVRLQFRSRLRLDPPLAEDRATALVLPRIRVLEGTALPTRVQVAADTGIKLAPRGEGWSTSTRTPTASDNEGGPPVRLIWTGTRSMTSSEAVSVLATAPSTVALPSLVASRLWLRTIEGLDHERHTTACYRVESNHGALSVTLPRGAELVRAQVGNDAAETQKITGGIRLDLKDQLAGPVLVCLEYRIPPEKATSSWSPPRLFEGGMVQETLWEVYVPWSRALVGTPRGWVGENRWYWAGYVWKRRPGLDADALVRWVGGPSVRGRVDNLVRETQRSGYHGYMFGCAGDPERLEPNVYSRAGLIGVFSAIVLAAGVVLLLVHSSGRLVGLIALAAPLALSATLWPDVTLLAVQASMAGVVMTLLAAFTKQQVDRRRSAVVFGEAGSLSGLSPSGSGVLGGSSRNAKVLDVGSDESTVIRRHPSTTIDFVPATGRAAGPENNE